MKKMKKIFAAVLTFAMVLGTTMMASAATKDTATITVAEAKDATLTYAQVIKANQKTKTGWDFVNSNVANAYMTAYGVTDAQSAIEAVIANTDANKLGNAQALAANYVTFAAMTNPQTVNAAGVYLVKATETGYTYNLMAAYIGFGKVVVNGTTYDYPSLVDAELTAKKTSVKVEKVVTDTDNVTHTGDVLTYTVSTNVPYIAPTDTDKTFFVYDAVTGGEYTNTDKVEMTLGGTTLSGYSLEYNSSNNGFECDFSKLIDNANSNAGKKIEITYQVAVTSENDVVTNTAKAGHKGGNQYGSKTVNVYEGNITLTKTDATDLTPLEGAGFEVRKDSQTSDALTFVKLADGVYKYDPEGSVTEVVTKADGTVVVKGLDVGTYYFKEVTAPKGYSINETDVTATLEVAKDEKAAAVLVAQTSMTDTKLSALPGTGGIGTTIFTVGGCLIMIAAAGLFFAKRKKEQK